MQAILSKLRNTSRSNSTVWIAMLVVLTMCLCAATASASGGGGIVVSQVTPLAGFPNGGALASGNAAGTTMAVNVDGNILTSTTYGNSVIMVNGRTGVVTTIGTFGNVGPVIVDGQSNLYVAGLYTNNIAKVPFVNGAYVDGLSSFSNTTPACTGSDTTVCLFSGNLTNAGNGYYFGVVSMAFDSSGNFFWAMTDANTAPNSIWECTVACLATGTPAAKLIWQEPAAATGDWMVGALAVDPWGRVFFTDSDIKNNTSYASNLYELPVSEGLGYGGVATGFAATPTLIENLTPATPGAYDDELDGLAIDPGSGTIYFATQYDGVWAIPNNSPGPILENIYQVSNQGAKTLALDGQSNAYVGTYNNSTSSDGILFISVNNLIAPLTAPGVAAAVPGVTALDSVGDCATGVLTFDFNGANPGDFAAAVSAPVAPAETTCSASKFGVGSVQPLTVTFTPTAGGTRSAGLLVTDVANYGAGAASISGQALLTQTITFAPTSPVTFDVGTITLAATGGDSGNPVTFSLISGPATLNSESGDQLTLTGVGSIVVAANQAGNAAYAAATEVQATIVVTPGVQVITFTSPTTVTFSTTPFTLTATGGGSGAPVNFTVLEGYALQSGTNGQTLTFTDYGSLSIRASQAGDANWLPATAQENITVNPGGQTADPIFTPPGGTFYMPQGVSVTMSDPTPGSVIYYNMNLISSPTTDDIVY